MRIILLIAALMLSGTGFAQTPPETHPITIGVSHGIASEPLGETRAKARGLINALQT